MRVALVSTQAEWHGGEEQARLLALGLIRRGHACTVLARAGGMAARRMAAEGLAVATFSGNGRTPRGVWQIRRHLRRLRPDVVHYNAAHALTSAGLASIGLGIGVRVASRRLDFPLRRPLRYRLLCNRVICVSRAVEAVCRQAGIAAQMLRIVPDGVDPARVRSGDRRRGRQSLGLGDDRKLLLCVAKLTDHKGHAYLLDALPSVVRAHPDVVLALAGDGELAEPMRAMAQRHGLADHVRFLGFRNDVPDLICGADLFVFPSYLEGLGSSLIDAMLAGVPIVTTTAGGICEVTGVDEPDQAPTAWSVPARDPAALAAAILEALASPAECAARAQRARQRAEQRFTVDCLVEATLAAYAL